MPDQVESVGTGSFERRLVGLPPAAPSVGLARGFVADALREGGLGLLVDDVTLAVSEVVTNAVVHAGTAVDLAVLVGPQGVRVEVADGSRRLPRVCDGAGLATTGRGLLLLAALAADWGAEPRPHGKAVWFRMPTVAG